MTYPVPTTTEQEFKTELLAQMFEVLMEEQQVDVTDGISAKDFHVSSLERFINDDFSSYTLLCIGDADEVRGAEFYWEGALPFGGTAYLSEGISEFSTDDGFLEHLWNLEQQARREYAVSYDQARKHFVNN